MRKFLIASHGNFSSGLKSSLELITGEQENIYTIDAYSDGNKSIAQQLEKVMGSIGKGDELIVFTDILGGSVTNQIIQASGLKNIHIVAGVNLPLILEVVLSDTRTSVEEALEKAIAKAKEQLVYVNQMIKNQKEHD